MARTKSQGVRGRGSNLTQAARAKGGKNSHSAISLDAITDQRRVLARRLKNNPIGMYILGVIGTFFLGRYLLRYYKNHPEIAEFVRDNFETVEGKLREFRGQDVTDMDARH